MIDKFNCFVFIVQVDSCVYLLLTVVVCAEPLKPLVLHTFL